MNPEGTNPDETIMEGHIHDEHGNHHGRTCIMNTEETIMEGHMHYEHGGNHHGRSHA